jgi:hypothetical protein
MPGLGVPVPALSLDVTNAHRDIQPDSGIARAMRVATNFQAAFLCLQMSDKTRNIIAFLNPLCGKDSSAKYVQSSRDAL